MKKTIIALAVSLISAALSPAALAASTFEQAAIEAYNQSGIAKIANPCSMAMKIDEPKVIGLGGGSSCTLPIIEDALVGQTFHCGFYNRAILVKLNVEFDVDPSRVDENGYVASVYKGDPKSVQIVEVKEKDTAK